MRKRLHLLALTALALGAPADLRSQTTRPDAAAAAPSTTDSTRLELRRLRPGVWLHTTHYRLPNGTRVPSHGLVVRDGDEAVLVDTPWGEDLTASLLERIAREIGLPVRRAIVTHAHGDRLAGADLLRARGVRVWAHPRTRRLALEAGMPLPTDTLAGLHGPGSAIPFGGLEVFYPGPGHAPDNVMVWLPAARVLFGGCAVRGAAATSLGNTAHADLSAWATALARASARYRTADLVVPGHAEPGGVALLAHTTELLERR
jgi:metallo-beta-lactamase class B